MFSFYRNYNVYVKACEFEKLHAHDHFRQRKSIQVFLVHNVSSNLGNGSNLACIAWSSQTRLDESKLDQIFFRLNKNELSFDSHVMWNLLYSQLIWRHVGNSQLKLKEPLLIFLTAYAMATKLTRDDPIINSTICRLCCVIMTSSRRNLFDYMGSNRFSPKFPSDLKAYDHKTLKKCEFGFK